MRYFHKRAISLFSFNKKDIDDTIRSLRSFFAINDIYLGRGYYFHFSVGYDDLSMVNELTGWYRSDKRTFWSIGKFYLHLHLYFYQHQFPDGTYTFRRDVLTFYRRRLLLFRSGRGKQPLDDSRA
jgi:hypothetical protein